MHMCTQITVVSIDEFSDTAGFMDRTDPYVSLTLGDETYKTTVKDNAGGKNVVFDEKLSFNKQLQENILKVFLSIWQMINFFVRMYTRIHVHIYICIYIYAWYTCIRVT